MKKHLYLLIVFSALAFTNSAIAQTTQTFNYTGSVQTFTVPLCVTAITVDVMGGEGGQAASSAPTYNPTGKGGRVQATIPVTPGDVLYIYVGQKGGDAQLNTPGLAGYNGGGAGGTYPSYNSSASGGGGGASDIRLNGTALNNRIIVAGGAGGGGTNCNISSSGGSGGGLTGGNGMADCTGGNTFGYGGDQTTGGSFGVYFTGDPGLPGTLGMGANSNTIGYSTIGGAGGGGYYGGGSGSLGAGGGGSSYTFPSATGVIHTQGSQIGNGQVILTYTLGIPANAGPITGPTDVCAGATVTYTTTNAVGATSYSWTVPVGAVINSGNGTTTISVTWGTTSGNVTVTPNNSCGSSTASSLAVNVNPAPVVNLGTNITQCGGTVTLNAGNPGSTYLWSTSATTQTIVVSASGTYSVTVTSSGGCTGTDAIDVTINTPPTVNLGADITQCGGTATLDALNPGAAYLWSTSATTQTIVVNTSGTYSVTVTDANGCTGTDVIVVTLNANPVVTLSLNPTITCVNWTAYALTGGSPLGGTYSGPGVTANMFNPSAVGQGSFTITYVYTDVNGCTDSAQQNISVDLCTGVASNGLGNAVTVTPNPSNGNFTLALNAVGLTDVNVVITDVQGKVVYQSADKADNNSYTAVLHLEELADGIYTVQVISNLGVTNEKIVVRK